MKVPSILALAAAGIVVAGCGTVRENRLNETAYPDHGHYDHDVVYRSPGYGEHPGYVEDDDVVYVRDGDQVIAVDRDDLIYGGDGYYYYRD